MRPQRLPHAARTLRTDPDARAPAPDSRQPVEHLNPAVDACECGYMNRHSALLLTQVGQQEWKRSRLPARGPTCVCVACACCVSADMSCERGQPSGGRPFMGVGFDTLGRATRTRATLLVLLHTRARVYRPPGRLTLYRPAGRLTSNGGSGGRVGGENGSGGEVAGRVGDGGGGSCGSVSVVLGWTALHLHPSQQDGTGASMGRYWCRHGCKMCSCMGVCGCWRTLGVRAPRAKRKTYKNFVILRM